MKLWSSWHKIH